MLPMCNATALVDLVASCSVKEYEHSNVFLYSSIWKCCDTQCYFTIIISSSSKIIWNW